VSGLACEAGPSHRTTKPAEAARFAFNRSDSFHESARWTVLTPLAHRVDILLRALEPRTHAPVGLIADPASEVPPLGLLLAARTEEDTLYAAVHGNLPSYHVQCGHRPIMLFRPNVRTAIRADVPMSVRRGERKQG
jgi:hypothetical protein